MHVAECIHLRALAGAICPRPHTLGRGLRLTAAHADRAQDVRRYTDYLLSLQPGSCGTGSRGAAARDGLGPPTLLLFPTKWCSVHGRSVRSTADAVQFYKIFYPTHEWGDDGPPVRVLSVRPAMAESLTHSSPSCLGGSPR